jgi:hypothetical protein
VLEWELASRDRQRSSLEKHHGLAVFEQVNKADVFAIPVDGEIADRVGDEQVVRLELPKEGGQLASFD